MLFSFSVQTFFWNLTDSPLLPASPSAVRTRAVEGRTVLRAGSQDAGRAAREYTSRTMPQPWEEFRVGPKSTNPKWTEQTCQPLDAVAHVAHVRTAKRVIEDYSLRADLVYDKSILNKQRIRVVWLSPNDWTNAGGFRYGNVRFEFDWRTIIEGKRFYWVESVAYRPPACRILVTDTDHGTSLTPYDPRVGDGPWWDDGGTHYWNGDYCLEFMYEGHISIDQTHSLNFVRHHPNYCNISAGDCQWHGVEGDVAGAQLLAWLVSSRNGDAVGALDHGFTGAALRIVRDCKKLKTSGAITSASPPAAALARALIGSLYEEGADKEQLASLFDSPNSMEKAVESVVAETLGIEDPSELFD